MATVTEVLLAVENLVMSIAYPDGLNKPSVNGQVVQAGIGYPNSALLDKHLKNNISFVGIEQMPGERDAGKKFFDQEYDDTNIEQPTISAVITGNQATFTGVATPGQTVLVNVRNNNTATYRYTILVNDTLNTIAAYFASVIPGCVASANMIAVAARQLTVSVSTIGYAVVETSRIEQIFNLRVFTNSTASRNALADALIKAISPNISFPIPDDYYYAVAFYSKSSLQEKAQKAGLYQKDILLRIEYSITKKSAFNVIRDAYVVLNRTH